MVYCKSKRISIHAPREGGDGPLSNTEQITTISIHAPREGGDSTMVRTSVFQAISIHAPREGGDRPPSTALLRIGGFQSTPPARGATTKTLKTRKELIFQSTPPARGATLLSEMERSVIIISIHAPREGGDSDDHYHRPFAKQISIHAPREGGDFAILSLFTDILLFQSTPPARGATLQ